MGAMDAHRQRLQEEFDAKAARFAEELKKVCLYTFLCSNLLGIILHQHFVVKYHKNYQFHFFMKANFNMLFSSTHLLHYGYIFSNYK